VIALLRQGDARRQLMRGAIFLIVSLVSAERALPQDGPATPAASAEGAAPGLLRLGPVYLTPSLRIWSLGMDTNVFYTATNRRTDFIAHGGPGLELLVPLHGALKLRADGTVGYLYFARTESQRRLTGSAMSRLGYEGQRLNTGAQYLYTRSFSRIGIEVDRRVDMETQEARVDLRYGIGPRFLFGLRATGTRFLVEEDQGFFGADLNRNLTRDAYRAAADFGYALTPKTSFVVETDYQADRFQSASERDTDSNRLGGGFVLSATTYLSGRAVAGGRSIRVLALPKQDRVVPYAAVDLTYHLGPRTRFSGFFNRDTGFSAFSVAEGDLPTITTQSYGLRLVKGLWRRLDLRLHGTRTELESDAPVFIDTGAGPLPALRDDAGWEVGADLGYAFWTGLRIGAAATWSERRSTINDLGVEGLLLGATVTYVP
jgi:hypothetical protein